MSLRPRQLSRAAARASRCTSHRPPNCRLLSNCASVRQAESFESPVAKLTSSYVPPTFRSSPKLAALHARLKLSSSYPLETLARSLIDPSAETNASFNNSSLCLLGRNQLSYYCSEYLLAKYPRLPVPIIFAAMKALVGPAVLADIARTWGVEIAAAPGPEVDSGLLQIRQLTPGAHLERADDALTPLPATDKPSPEHLKWRQKGISTRVVYDDEFGDTPPETLYYRDRDLLHLTGLDKLAGKSVTAEDAMANQVRSVFGGLYLHESPESAKSAFRQHILSRKLDVGSLFKFKHPTRDLSILCQRENLDAPVARLIGETGRQSRHPVYEVGVFSGQHKLGEAPGASLDEARIRASIAALKGWYLYSPQDGEEGRVPSDTDSNLDAPFKPIFIDGGDIVS